MFFSHWAWLFRGTAPSHGGCGLSWGGNLLPHPYLFTLIILPPQTGEGWGGGQPGGETRERRGEEQGLSVIVLFPPGKDRK